MKISQRARDGRFRMPGCGETADASGHGEGEERGVREVVGVLVDGVKRSRWVPSSVGRCETG